MADQKKHEFFHLPYKISALTTEDERILGIDRNFKELERVLTGLIKYENIIGTLINKIVEEKGAIWDEGGNAYEKIVKYGEKKVFRQQDEPVIGTGEGEALEFDLWLKFEEGIPVWRQVRRIEGGSYEWVVVANRGEYPAEYDIITTLGLDAGVIVTGLLEAERIQIGSKTTYQTGYDPSTKETPAGAQDKADAAKNEAIRYADENTVHKVEIFSTGGLVFKNGQISTTLIARVYKGKGDITDQIDANYFRWTRISDDPAADEIWNAQHYGGAKQITITQDDVNVRATFNCTILNYMEGD